jgi:tRNA(fMet)-specific endonuclease VapC
MTYLLDTDTFSNLVYDHARVELRYALVGTAATCISTVTVKEIEFGRQLHPERMTRLNSRIDTLLSEIPALLFDSDDARMAAEIEVNLTRAGKRIEKEDMMIAGTALAKGLILVTSNTRHFCRIDGLQLEDWRDGTLEVREPRAEYCVERRRPMLTASPRSPVTLS